MNEKDLRYILSANIRRYRNYRKLSQAEFAEMINISIPFLSDIENGKKWVSPRTLAKMADTLDIEAYELLRPEEIIPDMAANVIQKYTSDIHAMFEKNLSKLEDKYLVQLGSRK
jgi:transcriptional regulator with XRE-family HTH domain